MTPLLRRAATCAGLAAIGLSARSQAQIPTKPEPIVGGEIRRPLPAVPSVQQAAPPVVQQSPNGLFALSITDEGIELRGPSGGVKITNAGIEIGAPNSSRVTISATGMELLGDKALQLNARESVEIVNGPGANIVRLSPAGMELTGHGPVKVKGGGTVEIVNGTGINGVKITSAGIEIGSPNTGNVQVRSAGNVQLRTAGIMQLLGATVTLGCPGGNPVARVNDLVTGTTGGPGQPLIGGRVVAGSATVLAC